MRGFCYRHILRASKSEVVSGIFRLEMKMVLSITPFFRYCFDDDLPPYPCYNTISVNLMGAQGLRALHLGLSEIDCGPDGTRGRV